jgi:hypothetical protein
VNAVHLPILTWELVHDVSTLPNDAEFLRASEIFY